MYLTKVHITNVRCCEDLLLEFKEPAKSLLIAGDNGDGKSTVLRCLAMGLCDESSANGLLRELPGAFVRSGKESEAATIEIELVDDNQDVYKIITKIESLEAFEKLTQKLWKGDREELDQNNFPWHKIFACGYGPGIRVSGIADYQDYFALEAVYPLFRYDAPLQNPELAFRRIIEVARKKGGRDPGKAQRFANEMESHLKGLLKSVLNLEAKDEVMLTSTGIKVKSSRWGVCELGALGDGYRATTTWVMDLTSWWVLYLRKKSFYSHRDIEGIVLIDEVEQHLHPRWQLKIANLLSDVFGGAQFIVTTHSPLVISGSRNIPAIQLRGGRPDPQNVYGWRAEDVYREIMGLPESRPEEVRDTIRHYENLHMKKLRGTLTRKEMKQLNQLSKDLETLPGTDPVTLLTRLENMEKNLKPSHRRDK